MSCKVINKSAKSLLCLIFLAWQGFLVLAPAQPTQVYTFSFDQLKTSEILDSISKRCNVYFSYNADLPIINQTKSLNINATVDDVLKELLKDNDIEFSRVGNQVVIFSLVKGDAGKSVIKPTDNILKLQGTVLDKHSNDPLSYATVWVKGKTIGTITNASGEFVLKLPSEYISDTVCFSYMGYNSSIIKVDSMYGKKNLIKLEEQPIPIKPVFIIPLSGLELVNQMISSVNKNYYDRNALCQGFYREITKEEDNYINICEALVDVAKAPYFGSLLNDQVRIFKGHKSENVKRLPNLNYKLEGGVYNCLRLDVIKEQALFLMPENFNSYNFKYTRSIYYNNRTICVVEFEPNANVDDITYSGKLYIDLLTKALVAAKFELTSQALKHARWVLIKKQPKKSQIKLVSAQYQVYYRYMNGKWYLDYTKAELKVKAKSEKFLFNSNFTSVAEMVITNIDSLNTSRFKWSVISKARDILSDNIGLYDDGYWETYNVIKPEEPLQNAINAINSGKNFPEESSFLEKLF